VLSIPLDSGRFLDVAFRRGRNAVLEMTLPKIDCLILYWVLVFTQEFPTKEQAREAEQLIKSWKSRKMTHHVVEGEIQLEERIE